jgi:3-methyladenine DNA glycosylase AlkD
MNALGGDREPSTHTQAGDGTVSQLVAALTAAGSPERAVQEKRYLKSELQHLGVSVPAIRRIAVGFARNHPRQPRDEVVALVQALWAEPVHEPRMLAVELLDLYGHVLEPRDIHLVERLIRESRTWALVDGLSATVAGSLVERFPGLGEELDRWATDHDFWLRRASMLALLEPLRRGDGDFERFTRYADDMLEESEFFIRKAIGWVLREASKKQPERVAEWLKPRANRASGVTVREAVKRLSEADRATILRARHKELST